MPNWYGGSTLNPDELVPSSSQWLVQWQRVQRWFQRTRRLRDRSLREELDVGDIDVTIAFFQNAYHLRDWLLASRPDLADDLTALFSNSFEM